MALGGGKHVALAAVAVGLLLIAGGGLAYRDGLIQRWRTWKTEKAILKRLSSERHTVGFGEPTPLGDALKLLSILTGIKFFMTTEVASAMEKNGGFLVNPLILRETTGEELLRSILASADPNLEHTVKGDTVVIGLKVNSPGDVQEAAAEAPEE